MMKRATRRLLIATVLAAVGLLGAVTLPGGASNFRLSGLIFEGAFLLLAAFLAWVPSLQRWWRLPSITLLILAASVISTYQSSRVFGKVEYRSAFILQDFVFHCIEALVFLGAIWLIDRGIDSIGNLRQRISGGNWKRPDE